MEDIEKKEECKNCEDAVLKLESCEKEKNEYLDGWKRAKADLINYKKEEVERFGAMVKFANEALLFDLLFVFDSFELGLSMLNKESEELKGMNLIKNQLEEIAKRHGLEKIKVSKGDEFNPKFHEATGEIDSEIKEGRVVSEEDCGYVLNGKVLRPSKVKISKEKK